MGIENETATVKAERLQQVASDKLGLEDIDASFSRCRRLQRRQGETSATSQALPLIWRDRANFDKAAANYAAATAQLAALATANDTPGFTKQLEEVNQACGLCHARFKAGDQGPPRK